MINTPVEGLTLNIPDTNKPRVVIMGAGFGGLNTAQKLSSKDFQVVLIDKRNYHTFQPLLYQVATAGLQADAIAGPLRTVFDKKKDFHFRLLRALSIDPDNNTISTIAGDLRYDYLVISVGMRTNFFGNEEIKKYSLPLKSIPDALNFRSHLMQLMEWATITEDPALKEKLMTIVVGGGGPTGVEMAGALSELRKYVLPKDYPALDFSKMKIYLVEGGNRVLPPMREKSSARAGKDLEKMGVILKLNSLVDTYDGKTVTLKSGEKIDSYTMIWSAGVMPEPIQGIKIEWTERGRIVVDEYCKVKGSNNIYAIGDIALLKSQEYPKGLPGVAQPAIQMGKYIGKNLAGFHNGKSVKPFKYFDKGSLATIGRGKAVADLPRNLSFGGRPAWWIWLFVHVTFLVSFRNKILVLTNWIWNYFTYDKGNRLIIRPYIRKGDAVTEEIFATEES